MERLTAQKVKELMIALGADLCGIAGIDRFQNAPEGYHPKDVFPDCQSVISFGCRFPTAALRCTSNVPYTRIRNSISPKMDAIALDFCIKMEDYGVGCVPVPTNESQWDEQTGRKRCIISQKHAAQAAGLGTIGRHSLLITPEYGSMIWLGAVLCDQALEADELKPSLCNNCGLCINVCPVHALDQVDMNQQTCWDYAFGDNQKTDFWEISCHRCRDICPWNLGTKNGGVK